MINLSYVCQIIDLCMLIAMCNVGMFNIAFRSHDQHTVAKYQQGQHAAIVKCSRLFPCFMQESQTGLYLDFGIQGGSDNVEWAAVEYRLKQLLKEIVLGSRYPNSQIRVSVFPLTDREGVIHSNTQIESCVFNAVWLCLAKHGVPMTKSIFYFQSPTVKIALDLNHPDNSIYQEVGSQPPSKEQVTQQAQTYLKFVRQQFQQQLFK